MIGEAETEEYRLSRETLLQISALWGSDFDQLFMHMCVCLFVVHVYLLFICVLIFGNVYINLLLGGCVCMFRGLDVYSRCVCTVR